MAKKSKRIKTKKPQSARDGKDPITGEVIFGTEYGYDLVPKTGKTAHSRYFFKASPEKQGFDIFADSDKSGEFGAADAYLGFGRITNIDSTIQGSSGTFRTDKSRNMLEVFIGSHSVATISTVDIIF